MKTRRLSRHVPPLALLVLVLAGGLAGPCGAEDDLDLSGGPFLPYRISRAVIVARQGLVGEVSVYGLSWNGEESLLFGAKVTGWSESLDAAFYLDEETRSLRVEADTPVGRRDASVDLVRMERAGNGPSPVEMDRRAKMRSLSPPIDTPRLGGRPGRIALVGATIDEAGRGAAAAFSRPYPTASLAILGMYAVFASFAAGFSSWAGRRKFIALAAVTLAAALGTAALVPRKALFHSATLPYSAHAAAISGSLDAVSSGAKEYLAQRYGIAGTGIELVRVETPGAASLPLELVMTPGDDCRFSKAPLVVFEEGILALRANRAVMGWVVHEDE